MGRESEGDAIDAIDATFDVNTHRLEIVVQRADPVRGQQGAVLAEERGGRVPHVDMPVGVYSQTERRLQDPRFHKAPPSVWSV